VAVVVVAVVAACSSSPRVLDTPIARAAEEMPSDAHARAVAEAEAAFADRLDEARLRRAIDAWTRAIALRETDVAAYTALARAWYFLADGHLAFDAARRDEMKRAYEQAAAYAERGLRALSPEFERRRRAGEGVDAASRDLGEPAAPLLYWWALCVIRWADLDGWMTAAGIYKEVFRVMERVRVLDDAVDHAGPDRFFGAARAESPAIAGGSLTESRAFFDRAVALAPDYLETHLQIARTLARRAGDRALFEASVKKIADTAPDSVPDAIPEQEIARRKARAMTW
jgi:hypothetical protein